MSPESSSFFGMVSDDGGGAVVVMVVVGGAEARGGKVSIVECVQAREESTLGR